MRTRRRQSPGRRAQQRSTQVGIQVGELFNKVIMYNYSNDFLNFKMCVGEFDSLLSDESSDSVQKKRVCRRGSV